MLERRKNKSLDQTEIDSLRQGQRLDAIDQTQAWQGSTQSCQKRRENQELNKTETPTEIHFPLTRATLTTCMHSQSPVHNKFLVLSKIKQISPLFDHFSQKFFPLLAHAHIKPKICLNLPLKSCNAMNVVQRV